MADGQKKTVTFPTRGIVSPHLKDHGEDPYFIKKNEEARAALAKTGFPKELLAIKASKKK